MSKPLTIDELKALKVGDWVWISRLNNKRASGYVTDINFTAKMFTCKSINRVSTTARIADYGKTWTAYKNKEEAEKSTPDIKKKCCNNCRCKGFGEDRCDKLNKLFSDNGVQYEDGVYSSSNDKWLKRNDIMEDTCCDDFDSRWLEYPIAVTEVECSQPEYNKGLGHKTGKLVKIRPCGEEYGNKTYLGFYLGDLPISIHQSYNSATYQLHIFTHNNPAIFVPQLNKVIFGCESWWGKIDNPEELQDITDECINNQWYVKALKDIDKKGDKK